MKEMSLFPAYIDNSAKAELSGGKEHCWLQNASCPSEIGLPVPVSSKTSSDESNNKVSSKKHKKSRNRSSSPTCRKKKHRKKLKRSEKHCDDLQPLIKKEQEYAIDVKSSRNNLALSNTHYSELVRYDRLRKNPLGSYQKRLNKKNKKRYFNKKCKLKESQPCFCSLSERNLIQIKDFIPCSLNFEEQNQIIKMAEKSKTSPDIYDTATHHYIQGKSYSMSIADDTRCNDEKEYWQKKNSDYNKRLTQSPTNVSLWLEFVAIQDKMFTYIFNGEGDSTVKRRGNKALVERKLSILDNAIKKNAHILCLHLQKLRIGQEIMDNNKVKFEWDKLLCNFSSNILAWHHYLLHKITYFSAFNVCTAVAAFAKCTHHLQQVNNRNFVSHIPLEQIDRHQLFVTKQLAHFWKQCGYMERAVALYQALIEFNLFMPQRLQSAEVEHKYRIALFEAFWDTRAARIGEIDSVGWNEFMSLKKPVTYAEEILEGQRNLEDKILASVATEVCHWLQLESLRERTHWIAWQHDPDDCEDPDRMVAFEHLSKHIYKLNSIEAVHNLVFEFLRFLGMHCVWEDGYNVEHWGDGEEGREDVFAASRLESWNDFAGFGMAESLMKMREESLAAVKSITPALHSDKDVLQFGCRVIDKVLPCFTIEFKCSLLEMYINIMAQRYIYLKKDNGTDLGNHLKLFRKCIKSLIKLSECRNSLSIYLAFAKFEMRTGNVEAAEKILIASIMQGFGFNTNLFDKSDMRAVILCKLLVYYVQIQLQKFSPVSKDLHNTNGLLNNICCCIIEGKFNMSQNTTPPTILLKAKTSLFTVLNGVENVDDVDSLILSAAFLLCVVQMCSSGFDEGILIYETLIKKIRIDNGTNASGIGKKNLHYEKGVGFHRVQQIDKLYNDYLWLMTSPAAKCLRSENVPISLIKIKINSALEINANNQFCLNLLTQYQNWRSLLSLSALHSEDSIMCVVFRLLPLLNKANTMSSLLQEGSFSGLHQLHHHLSRALLIPPFISCPLLWRLYLRVCASVKLNSLKDVVHTAIHSCPFAKNLYLDAVKLLPNCLQEMLTIMSEKGIRVRLPYEELKLLLQCEEDHFYTTNNEEKIV